MGVKYTLLNAACKKQVEKLYLWQDLLKISIVFSQIRSLITMLATHNI